MTLGLEALANMEYPGRFIALGMTPEGQRTVVYGITGRSPSSQARRMVKKKAGYPFYSVEVEPFDPEIVEQGDASLLLYPAMLFNGLGIYVSNGAQTGTVKNQFSDSHGGDIPQESSVAALSNAHFKWEYEPDAPNFTPRISGFMPGGAWSWTSRTPGNYSVARPVLGIIRRSPSEQSERSYFELSLVPGEGHLITTYAGPNKNPLPSFREGPLPVGIRGNSPEEIANDFYQVLGENVRVSVAAAFPWRLIEGSKIAIVNRHE